MKGFENRLERVFDDWKSGVIYLFIVNLMPVVPAFIYAKDKACINEVYFCVLLLTIIIPFIYNSVISHGKNCSVWIIIEDVVCVTCLSISLFLVFTQLYIIASSPNIDTATNIGVYNHISREVLLCLSSAPILITVVEIIRSLVYDIKKNTYKPNEQRDIARGAGNV